MISNPTDLVNVTFSYPVRLNALSRLEGKHAKCIIAFVSCAKDSFEKVCLSALHTRVLFCVSLHFSLSVSEIEKEISQLKTKETVTFLQTFIYFPLFVCLC